MKHSVNGLDCVQPCACQAVSLHLVLSLRSLCVGGSGNWEGNMSVVKSQGKLIPIWTTGLHKDNLPLPSTIPV